MSDKDGQNKNKKNQARRDAQAGRRVKQAGSARNTNEAEDQPTRLAGKGAGASSSPSAARAYASKANKGK
jgi:hypothetical protein